MVVVRSTTTDSVLRAMEGVAFPIEVVSERAEKLALATFSLFVAP